MEVILYVQGYIYIYIGGDPSCGILMCPCSVTISHAPLYVGFEKPGCGGSGTEPLPYGSEDPVKHCEVDMRSLQSWVGQPLEFPMQPSEFQSIL